MEYVGCSLAHDLLPGKLRSPPRGQSPLGSARYLPPRIVHTSCVITRKPGCLVTITSWDRRRPPSMGPKHRYTSRFTGGRNGFEYLLASLGIAPEERPSRPSAIPRQDRTLPPSPETLARRATRRRPRRRASQ